jgi:hypothetical protein
VIGVNHLFDGLINNLVQNLVLARTLHNERQLILSIIIIMGGHALKQCQLRRYSKVEYNALKTAVLPQILQFYSHAKVPHELPTKETFGDLDVIVHGRKPQPSSSEIDPIQQLSKLWNSKEVVANGPVTSVEKDDFQIDIIEIQGPKFASPFRTKPLTDEGRLKYFQAAVDYMSWGDVGSLVGVIAKSLGLKFGVAGLEVPMFITLDKNDPDMLPQSLGKAKPKHEHNIKSSDKVDDNEDDNELFQLQTDESESLHLIGYHPLTQSIPHALQFLGFDHLKWQKGFENEDDIFQFFSQSKYFDPILFDPSSIKSNGRRRLGKGARPMYMRFTEMALAKLSLDGSNDLDARPQLTYRQKVHRKMESISNAAKEFGVEDEIRRIIESEEYIRKLRMEGKAKLNGQLLKEWTGLDGKLLGKTLKELKERFADEELERESETLEDHCLDDKKELAYFKALGRMDAAEVRDRVIEFVKSKQESVV